MVVGCWMSPQILVGKDMSRRSPEDLLKKFNGGDILWYIPPPPGLQRANQRFSSPRSNKAAGDQRGWGANTSQQWLKVFLSQNQVIHHPK